MPDEKHANGVDGHEERILRAESQIQELNERTVKHEVIISSLSSQIENAVERVIERIDGAVEPVARGVAEVTQRHNTLAEAVAKHQPVVDELLDKKRARAERQDMWRKAMWTISSGAAAILIKELLVLLFKHA